MDGGGGSNKEGNSKLLARRRQYIEERDKLYAQYGRRFHMIWDAGGSWELYSKVEDEFFEKLWDMHRRLGP